MLYAAKLARVVAVAPEPAVQRPGAVVPDPHGDAGVVEDLPDVVGVDALDDERDGAATVMGVGRADDADPRALRQALEQRLGQRVLVRRDARHPQRAEVVDRRGQATAWAVMGTPASNRCGGAA